MTTRTIKTEADRSALLKFVQSRGLPFTAEIVSGKRRSVEQNRLQRAIINEIAEQLGDNPEDIRAYCKLSIGVPILRAADEAFRARYDKVVRPLPYETKMALMKEPFDFPVTRLMSTTQKTEYLDAVMRHFAEQGVVFHWEGA